MEEPLATEATVTAPPSTVDRPAADVLRVARALASPTGVEVLRSVEHAERPVGVGELAERLRLHPNAVRKHLAHLRDAGLVVEEQEHRTHPGRPRLLYRGSDRVHVLGAWNPYEVLAALLVEVANGRPARQVGDAYGRRLAAEAPEDGPIGLLAGVARRHGFEPTVERRGDAALVVLGRCPFASTGAPDPVVCELHRGIVEGLAGASGTAAVAALEIAPAADRGCQVRLAIDGSGRRSRETTTVTTKET